MHIARASLVLVFLSAGWHAALAEGRASQQAQAQLQVIITSVPLPSVCAVQPGGQEGVAARVFCLSSNTPSFSVPGRADVFTTNRWLPLPASAAQAPSATAVTLEPTGRDLWRYESFILLAPDSGFVPEEIEVTF